MHKLTKLTCTLALVFGLATMSSYGTASAALCNFPLATGEYIFQPTPANVKENAPRQSGCEHTGANSALCKCTNGGHITVDITGHDTTEPAKSKFIRRVCFHAAHGSAGTCADADATVDADAKYEQEFQAINSVFYGEVLR